MYTKSKINKIIGKKIANLVAADNPKSRQNEKPKTRATSASHDVELFNSDNDMIDPSNPDDMIDPSNPDDMVDPSNPDDMTDHSNADDMIKPANPDDGHMDSLENEYYKSYLEGDSTTYMLDLSNLDNIANFPHESVPDNIWNVYTAISD